MKVSIVGAGAMGSLFGGKIAQSGHDVLLYDINKEHVQAVQGKGLLIEELSTGGRYTVHPKATDVAEYVRGSDVLIIFVKSTATRTVAEQFASLVSSETVVVTLQNGLGNESILEEYFGAHRTVIGVTSQGATFAGAGHIRHAGKGPTHLCVADGANERIEPLVDLLNQAGFETKIDADIATLVWSKLLLNVGINALTALLNVTNGELPRIESAATLQKELVEEAAAVAAAHKISLTYPDPVKAVRDVCEKTGPNRSSMLQDFDRGSASEIDFINGAICRYAAEAGIATPANRLVTALVKAHEEKRRL